MNSPEKLKEFMNEYNKKTEKFNKVLKKFNVNCDNIDKLTKISAAIDTYTEYLLTIFENLAAAVDADKINFFNKLLYGDKILEENTTISKILLYNIIKYPNIVKCLSADTT